MMVGHLSVSSIPVIQQPKYALLLLFHAPFTFSLRRLTCSYDVLWFVFALICDRLFFMF